MSINNIFFVGKKRFEEYFIKPFNDLLRDNKEKLPIELVRYNDLLELDIEVISSIPSTSTGSYGSFDERNLLNNIEKIVNCGLYKYGDISKELLKNITISLDNFKKVYKISSNTIIPDKINLFFYIIPSTDSKNIYNNLNELNNLIYFGKKIANPREKSVTIDINPPEEITNEGKKKHIEEVEKRLNDALKYTIIFSQVKNINEILNWSPIRYLTYNRLITQDKIIELLNKIKNDENPEFPRETSEILLDLLINVREVLEVSFEKIIKKGRLLKELNNLNVFVSDMKWCQDIGGYFLSSFCDKIERIIVLPCLHEIVGRAGELASRNDERTNCREEKMEDRDAMLQSEILDMFYGSRVNMNGILMIKNNIKNLSLEEIKRIPELRPFYGIAEKYKNYSKYQDCRYIKLKRPDCTSRDKIKIDWNLYLNFYKYGYRDEIYWNQQFRSQRERQFCRNNTFLGIFFNNLTEIYNVKIEFIENLREPNIQTPITETEEGMEEEIGGNKINRTSKNKIKTHKRKNTKVKSKRIKKHKFSKRR
jgi:hypothetical protein